MSLEGDGLKELAIRKKELEEMREKDKEKNKLLLEAVGDYLNYIYEDYAGFTRRNNCILTDIEKQEQIISLFKSKLRITVGNKYIKVISGNSAHSFIQREDDKKFKAGDILKAAMWAQPARNFSRGSIFEPLKLRKRITWTGAN